MHTYSIAAHTDFDLSHTPFQDVTNAWMLHTLSQLHKHTRADVTHNFSDVTHTHSDVPGLGHRVDTLVLSHFTVFKVLLVTEDQAHSNQLSQEICWED